MYVNQNQVIRRQTAFSFGGLIFVCVCVCVCASVDDGSNITTHHQRLPLQQQHRQEQRVTIAITIIATSKETIVEKPSLDLKQRNDDEVARTTAKHVQRKSARPDE